MGTEATMGEKNRARRPKLGVKIPRAMMDELNALHRASQDDDDPDEPISFSAVVRKCLRRGMKVLQEELDHRDPPQSV